MRKATFFLLPTLLVAAFVSIAVPNLIEAMQRSNQKRTMADMRAVAQALEARATETNTYALAPADKATRGGAPGDLRPLRRVAYHELQRALVPKYIKAVPRYDGWKRELEVRVASNAYTVRSLGSDGRPEGDVYALNTTISGYRGDLLFSDGTFVQYPEGT